MESELKLQVFAGKASQVLHAPAITRLLVDQAEADELTSTYFDTPDLQLHKNGASLRVRVTGAERLQTLKLDGTIKAGFFERDEFEGPVNSDSPDLESLQRMIPARKKAPKLLDDQALASRLQPLFVTRVKRSTAMFHMPQGTEVELAVDDGVIAAQAGSTAIHAVEMEQKSGAPEQLYELALAVIEHVPLRIDYLSKGDRGYELLVQEHRLPVWASPLKLKRRYTVEEAFQQIARNCLAQVHGNERGVVSGYDPSSVHQMRVGLRRFRSALNLFEDVITAPSGFDTELRWIAGELGEARDWEVLSGATLDEAFASATEGEDVSATRRAAKERAVQNRKTAAAAVDSVRYTRLVLKLTLWIETMGWREMRPWPRVTRSCSSVAATLPNSTMKRGIAHALPRRSFDMRRSFSRHCFRAETSSRMSAHSVSFRTIWAGATMS